MVSMLQKRIELRIKKAIEEKVFPGCVVGMVRANGDRFVLPYGTFTYESGSLRVKEDSLFDVASITKAIPTSSLALTLIDRRKLSLDDRLIDHVPEFHNSGREQVRIWHLLTQTLNFGFRLSLYKDKSPDELLDVICTTEFLDAPGTAFFYTNATSILLGMVVERVSGKCLADYADEVFFKPLGMTRATFFPEIFNVEEVVPTEYDEWRGRLIRGEVHDESAFTLRKKMVPGSAGLFSTVPDILNFLEMMLNEGIFDERRFLSAASMEAIQTNQLSIPGACAGLGWELCQPRYMGSYCSSRTFGKTGFTGCVCMGDCGKEIGLALLSNYTFPKRKSDMAAINSVRSDCADILLRR